MKKQGCASGFALVAPPRTLNLAVCAQLWAVSSTIVLFYLFLRTHTQITSQPQHEEQPDGTMVLTPTQVTSKRHQFAAQL